MRSTWDLEPLLPERVDDARAAIVAAAARIRALAPPETDPDGWIAELLDADRRSLELIDLHALARCAFARDVRDPAARAALATADQLVRDHRATEVLLDAAILALDEVAFARFAALPGLVAHLPALHELRAARAFRLAPALEALEIEMDRDGIRGWMQLYDRLVGGFSAEVEVRGTARRVSLADLEGLCGDADPAVRRAAFDARCRAWAPLRDTLAHALTNIVGARQQRFARRRIDPRAPSLHANRVRPGTVEALLAACRSARPALDRWLQHKARLLGKDSVDLHEFSARLPGAPPAVAYADAARLVIEAFYEFHPSLGSFAEDALARGLVDADAGPGRQAGGFCARFPRSCVARVFVTITGGHDSVRVLAHELGHAYHAHVLAGEPACRGAVPPSLAESASLFAEGLLQDHLVRTTRDAATRAGLLDQQLRSASSLLLGVPATYSFERDLYELRRHGPLTADRLDALTVAQQREAYGEALGEPDPHAWCARRHLFVAEFYNWPYTFGYLFAALLRARAREAGPAFLDTWRDLQRRAGWQGAEDLARETLGVDLGDERTWLAAIGDLEGRVDAFVGPAP